MTPRKIRAQVVLEKVAWIHKMLDSMGKLPGESFEDFSADFRNQAAMESYLRRALEALLDVGRHVLAKGFGEGVVEYKKIAEALGRRGVLSSQRCAILIDMAGYRNRLTHFYDEVTPKELYRILTTETSDIESVVDEILQWLRSNPEMIDTSL
jgi:uncharacterized protein YutE (UPF0331/DUF86 family)